MCNPHASHIPIAITSTYPHQVIKAVNDWDWEMIEVHQNPACLEGHPSLDQVMMQGISARVTRDVIHHHSSPDSGRPSLEFEGELEGEVVWAI